MNTVTSQVGKTGFPSSGNITSLTLDKIVDIERSRIPQYLDMVQKHPDMEDTFMAMSKEGKAALLKEVGDIDTMPKSPEAVHAITMSVISHAMSQGILDAAIILTFDKLPPISMENAKGGALCPSGITAMEAMDLNMKETISMFDKYDRPKLDKQEKLKQMADLHKGSVKVALNRATNEALQNPQWFPYDLELIASSAYELGLYETALVQSNKKDGATSQAHGVTETAHNAELAQIVKEYGLIGA